MPNNARSNVLKSALVVLVLLAGLASAAYYLFSANPQARNITVSNAIALPSSGSMPGLMVTLTLDNSGEPVVFTGVHSADAGNTHLMGGALSDVVLPGNGSVSFALDGTHIMMMAVSGDLKTGRLLPLHFTLGDGSVLKTQVTIGEADPMDHSQHSGMPGMAITPPPTVTLDARVDDATGEWVVSTTTTGFRFDTERVDVEHVPGAGHGHLYLNGVKLGRYYGGDLTIGQLPPGTHRLRLDLNTNLHQPYVTAAGDAVSGETRLAVD